MVSFSSSSHKRHLPILTDGTLSLQMPNPFLEDDLIVINVAFTSPGMRVNGDFFFDVEIINGSAGMYNQKMHAH